MKYNLLHGMRFARVSDRLSLFTNEIRAPKNLENIPHNSSDMNCAFGSANDVRSRFSIVEYSTPSKNQNRVQNKSGMIAGLVRLAGQILFPLKGLKAHQQNEQSFAYAAQYQFNF